MKATDKEYGLHVYSRRPGRALLAAGAVLLLAGAVVTVTPLADPVVMDWIGMALVVAASYCLVHGYIRSRRAIHFYEAGVVDAAHRLRFSDVYELTVGAWERDDRVIRETLIEVELRGRTKLGEVSISRSWNNVGLTTNGADQIIKVVSPHVEVQLARTFAETGSCKWGKYIQITSAGLLFDDEALLPYSRFSDLRTYRDACMVTMTDGHRRKLLSCNEPNFHPGFGFLIALLHTQMTVVDKKTSR